MENVWSSSLPLLRLLEFFGRLASSFKAFFENSLEKDLRARGVVVLPKKRVMELKQAKLAVMRPGIWKFLWPIARAYEVVVRDEERLAAGIATIALAGIIQIVYGGCMESGISAGVGIILGLIASIVLACILESSENFLYASSHWKRSRISADYPDIPARLLERLKTASKLGAELDLEKFHIDPLVRASRRRFLIFRETCYIGAWKTETELDHL